MISYGRVRSIWINSGYDDDDDDDNVVFLASLKDGRSWRMELMLLVLLSFLG
jgi:hypothetical protein